MPYIIESPFPSFNDTDGSPLNNGYVYVGSANLNPVTDPIPVYWDEALTQPAAQPIRTINGYLSRNGSPGRIYTSFITYSFRVTNNKGEQVFSDLNYTEPKTNAQDVIYKLPAATSVVTNVEAKLSETVSLKDFGAVGDGVTDDTAAIQAAIDLVASRGGGVVDCTGGRWLIDSADLIVKNGVTLEGPWNNLGETDNRSWANVKSAFILNSAYTIRLAQEFSGIKGMGVFRKGLAKPTSLAQALIEVANFAGKAITVGYGADKDASDTYVGNCLVLGFEYAYYCNYNERPRIEYLSGDNTNGVYLNRVYDMVHMTGCHFWPYITTHESWSDSDGGVAYRRQGKAYYFGEDVDWGQALNCFSYGYDTGFEINGSNNVVLVNCGQDGFKNNNTYSIGYNIIGTTKNTNLIGCKSASKFIGVVVDILDTQAGQDVSQCVKITGGNLWAASIGTGILVYVKRGNCIITGGVSMFDAPIGVKSDSTARSISIVGNIFQSIGTPYSLANNDNATIHSNLFNTATDSSTGFRFTFDNQQAAIHHTAINSSGSNSGWHSKQAAGTAAALSASPNGAIAARVLAYFYDTAAFSIAGISRFTLRAAPSAGSVPGAHIVSTTPTASATPIDRTIINEQGHLYPITDNAQTCGASGSRWSAIWAANGTIQTSDERSKTDIADSSLGLDFINALRPVSYKWLEGGKEAVRQVYRNAKGEECSAGDEDASPAEIITESKAGTRTHWGLVAQEVKSVADAAGVDFGGWVLSDKDDQDSQQALRYDQFIAPLIKAVQELSKKVADLEAK